MNPNGYPEDFEDETFPPEIGEEDYQDEKDYYADNMTDVEADADTLRSCGWGTDEDYEGDF